MEALTANREEMRLLRYGFRPADAAAEILLTLLPSTSMEGEALEMSSRDDVVSCYYCGLPANSIDHTVPQSLLAVWAGLEGNLPDFVNGNRKLTVPACQECNSILGAKYDHTLAERKQRLKDRLKAKYARFLNAPEWTPEELNELGPRLRETIESLEAHRQLIKMRIAW